MTAGDRAPERISPEIRALALLFVVALALRPQLVGAAALIGDISTGLGLPHSVAGFVGAIPVLCMGIFAFATPTVRRRLGTRATVTLSLALIALAGLARTASPDAWVFLLLTIVVGVGIGIGGAVLPVVVRQMTPARPVEGTASYSAGLQLGAALSAASAALLVVQLGGWQAALAVMSLAMLVPLGVWHVAGPRGVGLSDAGAKFARTNVDRRALVLALVFGLFGTVYYGFIAWLPDAYVEQEWSATSAGAMVAALNIASLVGALTISLVSRRIGYRLALTVMGVAFALASIGFVAAPTGGLGWAILAGYANGALFPLLLAQPIRIARAPDQVAWISAIMLGGGYTVAALAPVALGALRDATGSFDLSFVALATAAVLLAALTLVIGRQSIGRPAGWTS